MTEHGAGLLRLFTAWRGGAVIVAGTRAFPAPVVPEGPRVALDCPEPGCGTTVFGDDNAEAAVRLADHRRRYHW